MSQPFLDSNIFLRHLLNDDPEGSSADCLALIRAIEKGNIRAWTSELVIAEVIFVLTSLKLPYRVPREQVRNLLLPLINLPGLRLVKKRLYNRVFTLYTSFAIDYADAYHAALIEEQKDREIYSYDHDFDRIPSLKRIEPPLLTA